MAHSNEPKSECNDCGKEFLRSCSLKQHRLKHHSIKIECESVEISL
jgi:uncharacterized Zn-finger protein